MGRKVKICIEENCQNQATTAKYCRFHYIKNWKALKAEAERKEAKRLNRYVEGIMKRGPEAAKEAAADKEESSLEEAGYTDPDSLDEILTNIKLDR